MKHHPLSLLGFVALLLSACQAHRHDTRPGTQALVIDLKSGLG